MSNARRPHACRFSLLPLLLVSFAGAGCAASSQDSAAPDAVDVAESDLTSAKLLSVSLSERATGDEVFRVGQTRPATAAEEKGLRAKVREQATARCQAFAGPGAATTLTSAGTVDFGWRNGLSMSQTVFALDATFRCSRTFPSETALVDRLVSKLAFGDPSERLAQDELRLRVARVWSQLLDRAGADAPGGAAREDITTILADAASGSVPLAVSLANALGGSAPRAQVAFDALYGIWGRPTTDIVVRLAALDAVADRYLQIPEALRTRVLELLDYLHPLRSPDSGFGRPELAAHNDRLVAIAAPEVRSPDASRRARAIMLLADTGERGMESLAYLIHDVSLPVAARTDIARNLSLYAKRDLVNFAPIQALDDALALAQAGAPIAVASLVDALVEIAGQTGAAAQRAFDAKATLARLCPNGAAACIAASENP